MSNRPKYALEPCGTASAYRRHHRHGEKPCESCKQAEARRRAAYNADPERREARNAAARKRYAELRANGMSAPEAKLLKWRAAA